MVILEAVVAFVQKVGSILVDRRAWFFGILAALALLPSFFGVEPAMIDAAVELLEDGYTTTEAIVAALLLVSQGIVQLWVLGKAFGDLVTSWGIRPPSGLFGNK